MIDETGRVSEAQLTSGRVPLPLPQIQIKGNEVKLFGATEEQIRAFLSALPMFLGDTAGVIVKITSADKPQFEVTEYAWNGHDYQEDGTEVFAKAPLGIWLDSLAGSEGQGIGWSRIFSAHVGRSSCGSWNFAMQLPSFPAQNTCSLR